MKKLISITFLLLIINGFIFSQSKTENISNKNELINPKTGFPEITQKPFIVFNEGLSAGMINRIEKQDSRSNFVRENYLIGAYFEMQTENMKPINSLVKVTAYYPFYNTFNGMKQYPKQVILYAFDLFAGPVLQADMWNYVHLKIASGLHYMYQLTDEYHMNYLGLGVKGGIELPVAKRWTILLNGLFTVDYPNLGTNKNIQPFDISWQYHIDFGIRYSKKKINKYSYIKSKSTQNEILQQESKEISK